MKNSNDECNNSCGNDALTTKEGLDGTAASTTVVGKTGHKDKNCEFSSGIKAPGSSTFAKHFDEKFRLDDGPKRSSSVSRESFTSQKSFKVEDSNDDEPATQIFAIDLDDEY